MSEPRLLLTYVATGDDDARRLKRIVVSNELLADIFGNGPKRPLHVSESYDATRTKVVDAFNDRDAVVFVLHSPDFESVPDGMQVYELPEVVPTLHDVKYFENVAEAVEGLVKGAVTVNELEGNLRILVEELLFFRAAKKRIAEATSRYVGPIAEGLSLAATMLEPKPKDGTPLEPLPPLPGPPDHPERSGSND